MINDKKFLISINLNVIFIVFILGLTLKLDKLKETTESYETKIANVEYEKQVLEWENEEVWELFYSLVNYEEVTNDDSNRNNLNN